MENSAKKQDFIKKLLVRWLAAFSFLIPLCFCFYTYDSAQVKITLFYIASCGAFFIWLSGLIYKRQSYITKKNFYTLLPLIIYILYLFSSYFFKPYRLARLDSFTRELFCITLFLPACFELEEEDFKTLLKYFFKSAWLVFIYGILQIFNLDFLPWKNFFGNRIFATMANPNFLGSFAVFTSVLSVFSFLISRKKSLIVLFVLALINLIFTQSKGAWLAFGFTLISGGFTFLYFFSDTYKKHQKKIFFSVLIVFILSAVFAFCFSVKRGQSVSFRLSTWRATLDMIQASPLTGTGLGSFEFIYPAYKRPEIFYMEKLHNMESQHAENYYLEQCSTLGLLGFGLFLWVFLYVSKQAFFSLKKLAKEERQKAFLLAGFCLAGLSIYIHNFVDVSIYFVSTGFFLILFNAAILKLSFGPFEKISSKETSEHSVYFKPVFFLTLIALAGIFTYIQIVFWKDFYINSKSFLAVIYSTFFIGLFFAVVFLLFNVMKKTKKTGVCLLALITGVLCLFFWFGFMSNVCFSRATSLAEKGRFESLGYYTKAIFYNPFSPTLRNFRGLQFTNRFDLTERRDTSLGDGKETSNDYKRALRDFEKTKELAPNIVLLHYNIGNLYLKYASKQTGEQRTQAYLKAEENFKHALLLDPVEENIYFQLANMELERSNLAKAIFWVKEYIKGPKEVKNPEYLQVHKENQKAKKALKDWGGTL